jgi:hypothetical protein
LRGEEVENTPGEVVEIAPVSSAPRCMQCRLSSGELVPAGDDWLHPECRDWRQRAGLPVTASPVNRRGLP